MYGLALGSLFLDILVEQFEAKVALQIVLFAIALRLLLVGYFGLFNKLNRVLSSIA